MRIYFLPIRCVLAIIMLFTMVALYYQHFARSSRVENTSPASMSGSDIELPVLTKSNPKKSHSSSTKTADDDLMTNSLNSKSASTNIRKVNLYKEIETIISDERDLSDQPGVQRVRLIRSDFKYPLVRVEERFADGNSASEPSQFTAMVADHVILSVASDVNLDSARRDVENLGYTIDGTVANQERVLRVKIPATSVDDFPNALLALKASRAIAAVEPDFLVFHHQAAPNDSRFDELWAHRNVGQSGGIANADISSLAAWARTTGSEQVVVAVIDSGVDYEHPDLLGNMYQNVADPIDGIDTDQNGYVDDSQGWNFYANSRDPMDDHYHGTHVAGTIGATGNNASGVVGVCWRTRIMPLKFLSSYGTGATSDAIAAIRYAADQGARILNNSWGGGGYSVLLQDAIQYASNKNCLFITASGNSGSNIDVAPSYPASYSISTIASVAASNHYDAIAGFSNYGPTSVDLAAPGVGILSTTPRAMTPAMSSDQILNQYTTLTGTSMAAAHVSGAAALLLSQEPSLTAYQVKTRMLMRSDFIPQHSGFSATSSRLNLNSILDPAWQPQPALLLVDQLNWQEEPLAVTKDEIITPSERIQIVVSAVNKQHLDAIDTNLHFQIISGPAALVNGSHFPLGTIQYGETKSPIALPVIRIHDAAADGEIVRVRCTCSWQTGQSVVRDMAISVVKLNPLQATASVPFDIGEIASSPGSNNVYLVSPSQWRLYAFDTELGKLVAVRDLDQTDRTDSNSVTGGIALSPSGDRLFVALTGTRRIQSFSLPDLTPISTFLYNFSPSSLAVDSQNRLYASSSDGYEPLRRIDAITGLITATSPVSSSGGLFYKKSLLRTCFSGDRLYHGNLDLHATGGPAYVTEWDTTSATPFTKTGEHPMVGYYMKDFSVDEFHEQLLSVHSAIHAVQMTSFQSGEYGNFWGLNSKFPVAVAHHPDSDYLYAGTRDSSISYIRRLRKGTGSNCGDYRVLPSNPDASVKERGIVVTDNQRVFYVSYNGLSHHLNLIGVGSIDVTLPMVPPMPPRVVLEQVEMSDSVGNNDGIASPGEAVDLIPTLRNVGTGSSQQGQLSISCDDERVTFPEGVQSDLPIIQGGKVVTLPALTVHFDSTMTSGTYVNFTFTITMPGGLTSIFGHRMQVKVPSGPAGLNQSTPSGLQFSGLVAHPTANEVYLVDSRNLRVIALSTASGTVRRVTSLPVTNRLIEGQLIKIGSPAVSPDGSLLAVAMGEGREIHILSLPELSWKATLPVNFSVTSLVFDASNRIHAISSAISSDEGSRIKCLNSDTGEFLFSYGPITGSPHYLRMSRDGSVLALSIDSSVCLYNTTTNEVPSLLSSFAATGSSILPVFARDIDIDPAANLAYVIKGDGKVTHHRISDGALLGSWNLCEQWGNALRIAPDNKLYGASDYYYGGGIRKFDRATGTPLQDSFFTGSVSSGQILIRGIDVTANGRVAYLSDGYSHGVGILGMNCDLTEPEDLPFSLLSLEVTDPSPANHNGNSEPGETIRIKPTIKHFGIGLANNITANISTTNPRITIGAPSQTLISSLNLYEIKALDSTPITIGTNVIDGESLDLFLTLTYEGVQQTIPLRMFASQTKSAVTKTNFVTGAMLGHPAKPISYVIDETRWRVLAIDTAAGSIKATVQLDSDLKGCHLALSADGNQLYVSLGAARGIQVLSAETLAPIDLLHVGIAPGSIVVDQSGFIYATSINSLDYLWKIDPMTGAGKSFGAIRYALETIIKSNQDHNKLYVFQKDGFLIERKVDLYDLDISFLPQRVARYNYSTDNVRDFVIDQQQNRIFLTRNGGGIQVTDMSRGHHSIVWPSSDYFTNAIAMSPGNPFVYAATISASNSIRRYDRVSGTLQASFVIPVGSVMPRRLVVTAGEKLMYSRQDNSGSLSIGFNGYHYYLGLIGTSSLDLTEPAVQPSVNLGPDRSVSITSSLQITPTVDFPDATGEPQSTWRTIEGPGNVVYATHDGITTLSFSTAGRYLVEYEVVKGGLSGSDRIWVDSSPTPKISIFALHPYLINHPTAVGGFVIVRDGDISEPLTVQLSVSGTAIPGYHYTPLQTTLVMPSGKRSVNLLTRGLTISQGETVQVRLLQGAGFLLGVASSASAEMSYTNFSSWLGGHQAANADLVIDATSDNDGDGVSSMLEYILARDPLAPSNGPPLEVIPVTGSGDVQFRYRALQSKSGVRFEVQFSPDLKNWNTYWMGEFATQTVGTVTHQDNTETITFRLSNKAKLQPRKFVRLHARLDQ